MVLLVGPKLPCSLVESVGLLLLLLAAFLLFPVDDGIHLVEHLRGMQQVLPVQRVRLLPLFPVLVDADELSREHRSVRRRVLPDNDLEQTSANHIERSIRLTAVGPSLRLKEAKLGR